MDLNSFLQVNHNNTLRFFYKELRAISEARELSQNETLHVATVLAHHAQSSMDTKVAFVSPFDLAHLTNIAPIEAQNWEVDREFFLFVAGQTLLFGGFFRDGIKRRYEAEWYDSLGQIFYRNAVSRAAGPNQRDVFQRMAKNFPAWTIVCRDLNRRLRQEPYLLRH